MDYLAIIQARMDSRRLPGKVLLPLIKKPILWHVVNQLKKVKDIDKIVVATTIKKSDLPIVKFCKKNKIESFRGREEDVLDRLYQAALRFRANNIIRITADSPLIDPGLINKLINLFKKTNADLAAIAAGLGAKNFPKIYPSGLDTEVIKFSALQKTWNETKNFYDREHVTPYIWRNATKFKVVRLSPKINYSMYHLSIDNKKDLQLVRRIYKHCSSKKRVFNFKEVISYSDKQSKIQLLKEFKDLKSRKFKVSSTVDSILILSGGETDIKGENGDRIRLGLSLFNKLKKKSKKVELFFSGTKTHTRNFRQFVKNLPHKSEIIINRLPDDATTLIQVENFKKSIIKYKLKTIILITHLYHLPRTERYVRKFFPEKVEIHYHPVRKNFTLQKISQEAKKIIEYAKKGDIELFLK